MDFKKLMESRRAVNFFDPSRTITDEELKKIIETATLAPSSFNLQPRNLIVVRSPEAKKKLRQVAWDQAKVEEASVVLIVLADREGWKPGEETVEKVWRDMVEKGYMKPEQREWFNDGLKNLYGSSEEKTLAFAVKNASLFAMSLMLAAKDLGIDSHPMDGFDQEGVKTAFDIPERFFVPMLIALGHFDESKTLLPPKFRKGYEELVIKEY